MPPAGPTFAKGGSSDDDDNYDIKGREIPRCFHYMKKRVHYGFGLFFTICSGAAPLLMNIIMGDMLTTIGSKTDEDKILFQTSGYTI